MDNPTEEQLSKFWNYILGKDLFESRSHFYRKVGYNLEHGGKLDYIGYSTATIDLNNLFKYAIPKFNEFYFQIDKVKNPDRYIVTIAQEFGGKVIKKSGNKPALILFWAISTLIENFEKEVSIG